MEAKKNPCECRKFYLILTELFERIDTTVRNEIATEIINLNNSTNVQKQHNIIRRLNGSLFT